MDHGIHSLSPNIGMVIIAESDHAIHSLLPDIAVAIIAATALGLISHWLRQPIILGYLIAGALIGPQVGFAIVQSTENINTISEIGLLLLLFLIGLEINIKELMKSGKQLLLGGVGQFPICVGLGGIFFALMSGSLSGASTKIFYLAVMCALSSTAIVVKILYDKREIGTLPGRLTLGILVMQDVYAILVLAIQPNLANPSILPIAKAIGATLLVIVAGFVISRYVLSRIFTSIAKSPELVLSVSIGWCALIVVLAGSLDLSIEMGALIAGVCISAFPYSIHVTAKTLPLRDFFLTLFFVSLGMKIMAPSVAIIAPVLIICLFVILSRFLSVYPLLVVSGAGRRAAFVSSLNLAQISEFSLVIATLGLKFDHIGRDTMALMIYAMGLMAVASSYGIRFNHHLFLVFDKMMRSVGFKEGTGEEERAEDRRSYDVVVLGCHRIALAFIHRMGRDYQQFLRKIYVIDFNPLTLDALESQGVQAMFGDISSMDTLEHAHLSEARFIVLSIPDMLLRGVDNLRLLKICKQLAPNATIVATADNPEHEAVLKQNGAGLVITPFDLAGENLAEVTAEQLSLGPQPQVAH